MLLIVAPALASPPRALFVGSTYAGWRTRQLNLERHVLEDGRLAPTFQRVSGWHEGGLIERLPLLPAGARGRLRALSEASALARAPAHDVTLTSLPELLPPYRWAMAGPLRRPLVLELDWTLAQRESMAPAYYGRDSRQGWRRQVAEWQQAAAFAPVSRFVCWSNWAAEGLRAAGVQPRRIRVIPPGIDLDHWRPAREPRQPGEPLRLLFVGADFARKGGVMLAEMVATRFAGRCLLDIVTPGEVPAGAGISVHRCQPNSPELMRLYARADLFVLPTTAECFGIATIEALASGLPVIAGDVGGARDIVDEGDTGWLIEPGGGALAAALERALERHETLPAMGARGRQVAEARFDGRRNDRQLVDLLVALAARRRPAQPPAARA